MAKEAVIGLSEQTIRHLDPLPLKMFIGGGTPTQNGLRKEDEYKRLAGSFLHPIVVENQSTNEIDYFIVAPPLRGLEINYLFHFAAPSKTFGVDTGDIRSDWHDLFENPANKARLEAHRRIAGWTEFELHREQILQAIEKDADGLSISQDVLIPVIHLQKDNEGNIKWNFDPLDETIRQEILKLYPDLAEDSNNLLSILGPCLAAAYSPTVTKAWGESRTYTGKGGGRTQDMGATQALPLTIGLASDLIQSTIVTNIITYCDTGNKPEASIEELISDETSLLRLDNYANSTAQTVKTENGSVFEKKPKTSVLEKVYSELSLKESFNLIKDDKFKIDKGPKEKMLNYKKEKLLFSSSIIGLIGVGLMANIIHEMEHSEIKLFNNDF